MSDSNKLVVEMFNRGPVAYICVVSQPDDIKRGRNEFFKGSDGRHLTSASRPGIVGCSTHVGGEDSYLDSAFHPYKFDSEAEAVAAIESTRRAVKEFNESREKKEPVSEAGTIRIIRAE